MASGTTRRTVRCGTHISKYGVGHGGHTAKYIRVLKQADDEARALQEEFDELEVAVEDKRSLHLEAIEKAYEKALEIADGWRDYLENKKTYYDEILLDCKERKDRLRERTKRLNRLSREQLFESLGLSKSQANRLTCFRRYEDFIDELSDELNSILPISTPELTFTEPNHGVRILDRGKVLISVDDSRSTKFAGAVTDAQFQTGRHYWEVEASFHPKTKPSMHQWVFSAGVAKGVPQKWYVGACDQSWGVVLAYSEKQYSFYCRYKGRRRTDPVVVCPSKEPEEVSLRVGFYLDCTERTLVILDCDEKCVLHMFMYPEVSEPLIPAVSIHGDQKNRSVRLMPGNLSNLFQVLPKLLKE